MSDFTLHPRLAADTFFAGDLPLCRILLLNDRRFPWLVLVPRRPDVCEILDLPSQDRILLMEEITTVSRALQSATAADKLNVAAIGNIVNQLHVHVVARFASDPAWPGVVWGHGTAVPYDPEGSRSILARLVPLLQPAGLTAG